MFIALKQKTKQLYDWLINLCNHKRFNILMAMLFFSESIFFPIPIDPLLILVCLKKPTKAFFYGLLATISSVLGGITAYYIGAFLWDTVGLKIINNVTSPDSFKVVCTQLAKYESWAVLMAGFTPFPYKAMTIVSGFCRLPLMPFIIFSIVSRGSRFILIAALAKRYGMTVQHYIDRYGMILLILFTLISIMSYCLLG